MKNEQAIFPLRYWIVVWYSLVFLIGCIGNAVVIVVVLWSKNVQKSSSFNIYILMLALADLFTSFLGLVNYILSTMKFDHPTRDWDGDLCRFYAGYFLSFWFMKISTYLLVAISLDRRKAIVKPLSTLQKRPLKKTLVVLLFIILLAFCDELPIIIGLRYNETSPTVGNSCSFTFTRLEAVSIYVVLFILQTLIPIFLVSFSFIQVRIELHKQNKSMRTTLGRTYEDKSILESKLHLVMKSKLKTVATMRLLAIVFFVCVFPHDFLYVLFQFGDVKSLSWNSWPYQIAMLLRFSNSCINPLLYSFHSKTFRRNFREVFRSSDVTKTSAKRSLSKYKKKGYSHFTDNNEAIVN